MAKTKTASAAPGAAAPSRATTKTTIQFGMVPINVDVFSATENPSGTGRNNYVVIDGEYHPVGKRDYDKVTDESVAYADIVKCASAGDKIVPVTDDEIYSYGHDRMQSQIIAFVPRERALGSDAVIVQKAYQVRPSRDKVGKDKRANPANEKAFALLMRAIEDSETMALVKFTLRDGTAAKYGLLDQSGLLLQIHYTDDVRAPREMPEAEVTEQEAKLAAMIVKSLKADDVPPLRNEQAERVAEIVAAKLAGEAITPVQPEAESYDSLMDLLQKSVVVS